MFLFSFSVIGVIRWIVEKKNCVGLKQLNNGIYQEEDRMIHHQYYIMS